MNATEWNAITDFLETAVEGNYVEFRDRIIEVTNMVGGRFLLIDENGEISGLTNVIWKACQFLKTGKVFTH